MVIWIRRQPGGFSGTQFYIWQDGSLLGKTIDGEQVWSIDAPEGTARNWMSDNSFWQEATLLEYAQRMEEGTRCRT